MEYKFSTQDVADIIRVTKPTIHNWINEGRIECAERDESNNRYLFNIDNVKNIVKNHFKRDTKIITFANIKGGVGKTFCTINFALLLKEFGFKILVVDTDKQANMSEYFLGEIPGPNQITIYNIYNEDDPGPTIRKTHFEEIDIIPSNPKFAEIENKKNMETYVRLQRYFETIRSEYDFIVIDTPPDIGTPVEGALVATEYLYIVLDPDKWAIHGIDYCMKLVNSVNSAYKRNLKINACIANKIDERRIIDKEILPIITRYYPEKGIPLLKPSIPQSTKYKEFLLTGDSIISIAKEDQKRLLFPIIEITLGVLNGVK